MYLNRNYDGDYIYDPKYKNYIIHYQINIYLPKKLAATFSESVVTFQFEEYEEAFDFLTTLRRRGEYHYEGSKLVLSKFYFAQHEQFDLLEHVLKKDVIELEVYNSKKKEDVYHTPNVCRVNFDNSKDLIN